MILQRTREISRTVALAALALCALMVLSFGGRIVAFGSPTRTPTPSPNTITETPSATAYCAPLARSTITARGTTSGPDATRTLISKRAALTSVQATETSMQATQWALGTRIIAEATQTAAIDQTRTATVFTATPVPSVTPTPTFTPTPRGPLSQQVGFSDPEIHKWEAARVDILDGNVEFTASGHQYRLLYMRSSFHTSPDHGGIVALYQTDSNRPKFLWSHDFLEFEGLTPQILAPQIMDAGAPPPGEWNGDGKVFFAVYALGRDGAKWPLGYYFIYEIRPDGSVVSRLNGVMPPGIVVSKIERQNGVTLLYAFYVHSRSMDFGSPISRYYRWSADKITNISSEHLQEYFPTIGYVVYRVTITKVVTDIDARFLAENLYMLLACYDAVEQRDAGWALVQDLVSEAKRTNRLAEGTYIDKVFMPTVARLYKENRALVPPEWEVGYYDRDSE